MSKYRLTPAVLAEIEDIATYIAIDNPSAARRFVSACHQTFASLADMPRSGRRWHGRSPRTRSVRVWRVTGFPSYLVFYRLRRDHVLVLHVLSGLRDLDALIE